MSLIPTIRKKASENPKTIVLPRSSDPRVIAAAIELHKLNLCKVLLIKNAETGTYPDDIEVINPSHSGKLSDYAERFYERRKHKGLSLKDAEEIMSDPLYYAAAMVAAGDADGCVAGSVSTTGEVLRAAIQVIGLKPGSDIVSSVFMMSFGDGRTYTYGDCAVVPYPDSAQLAGIALDSSETHHKLTGEEPRTAMLSFSTKGSASHERIDLVRDALELVRENQPDLKIDGELQFDAALLPEIAERKAPGSKVAGSANVFIFPNLDAGNIAYKITERLAGATATGPVIQGLAKPMMDLSRGCSSDDIVNTACVSALMSH